MMSQGEGIVERTKTGLGPVVTSNAWHCRRRPRSPSESMNKTWLAGVTDLSPRSYESRGNNGYRCGQQ